MVTEKDLKLCIDVAQLSVAVKNIDGVENASPENKYQVLLLLESMLSEIRKQLNVNGKE